jgi:hypothetical protein
MREDTPLGNTMNPEQVSVTCDGCGEPFITSESAAHAHDQQGEPLLYGACNDGEREHPSRRELESPQVNAVRDGRKDAVGPGAEPDISVAFPNDLLFGELAGKDRVPIVVKKGTEKLGRVTVRPLSVDSLKLRVKIAPTSQCSTTRLARPSSRCCCGPPSCS